MYRAYKARQAERLARMQQQQRELVSVTFIEGWTNEQVAEQLEKKGLFSKQEFLTALNNFDESQFPLVSRPGNKTLEGYLFPDTYEFYKDSTPDEVIKKMLTVFSQRLAKLGVTDPNQQFNGLSLFEIITLASIIEKESGGQGTATGTMSLAEERDLIASVFYNRLEIGQALQSDATVNYVTGKDTPAVSAADLQINSAYNTYKYPGLPPGPISNPSQDSIRAAIHPAQSDYIYFLHKQPSGAVYFSRTYEEHVQRKLE